ncbi:MAG: hypothetical protein IPL65_00815 [Lewinellaceae bacterium]|nr:hypothetical protein [Lewinellaceae bacterium]
MENRYLQLIEKHLHRELTAAEQQELDEILLQNPILADDMAWRQKVMDAWTLLENRRLKSILQQAEAGFQQSKVVKFDFRRLSAIAAALLAVVAAVWFLRPVSAPDAADFFSAYPDKIIVRSEGQGQLEQQAIQAYQAGNFKAAAIHFGKLQSAYPDSLLYAFYHGVALVGAQDYTRAEEILLPVSQQNEFGSYQTNALWYLALAQTGAKDFPSARKNLEAYLKRPDAVTYKAKAQLLLKKLPT